MAEHTPTPWTTRVIAASVGLESTGYAHQIVKGGREYTVAHSDHQNWDHIHTEPLSGGYVKQTGIGKREPDLKPHPDAARIVACVNAFHDPNRSIATEHISEGLVFRLRDALKVLQECIDGLESDAARGLLPDPNWHWFNEARALLASLQIEEKADGGNVRKG